MRRPFLVGLTGSIGMGKSTVAAMFRDAGLPVWDADAAVHRLYAAGGEGVAAMQELYPEAVIDGAVDRARLKEWIAADAAALARIERVVHPLVARDRADFIAGSDAGIVVLDIPLLFETGSEAEVDLVVVVSAPADVQRRRVMARPGMTGAQLERILAKQLPDTEKRARAGVVICSVTLEDTRRQVDDLVARLRKDRENA